MSKKEKKSRAAAQTVLMPIVSEQLDKVQPGTHSEEELRALATLENIERDLFGTSSLPHAAAHTAQAAVALLDPAAMQEDEGEFEVSEPVTASQMPPDPEDIELPPLPDEMNAEFKPKPLVESSGEDFSFLLGMDYEDELGDAIGFEKIRSYHEKMMNGRTAARKKRRGSKEFETQSQDVQFRRNYAKQKTGRILHLSLSLLLLLVCMLYERPALVASVIGGPLDGEAYPTAYILFGLQLLVFNVALSYRSLWEGFVRLIRFSPVDYSLSSVMVIATLVYHFVLLFLPHATYPALLLSPLALSLSLLSLVELLNWYRESLSFEIVSARRQKFAMVPRMSVGSKQGSAKERLLHDEDLSTRWFLRPVGFVREYISNTAKHMEHQRNMGAQLLISLSLGVAFGLFSLAGGSDAAGVLRAVFITVLLCTPVTSLLLTSVPMFFAAVFRLKGRGAIIGEKPIADCSLPATLVLPDREIFAAMEHEHFRLMEGCDAHRVSVLVRALLEKVESPLAEAFGVDLESRLNPAQMTLTDVGDEGVSAEFGKNAHCIRLGSVSYMKQYDVSVQGLAQNIPDAIYHRLLCVAVDGRVCALFLVRYHLADDVVRLIKELDRSGVRVIIRTKDPCVRAGAVAYLLPRLVNPVEVMKPAIKEMEVRADRVDSTVVALGSCMEVARTYAVCRRISRVGVWGRRLQALLILLGGVFSGLLTLVDRPPSAFIITVWLMLWCAVYGVFSYLFLHDTDEGDAEEQ